MIKAGETRNNPRKNEEHKNEWKKLKMRSILRRKKRYKNMKNEIRIGRKKINQKKQITIGATRTCL